MKKNFQKYLDRKFFVYFKSAKLNEYKEELLSGMMERFEAYKSDGLSDEDAYRRTVERFGDVASFIPAGDLYPNKKETMIRAGRYVAASALYWVLLVTVYLSVCLIGMYDGNKYWGIAAQYTFPFGGLLFISIALFGCFRTAAVYRNNGALPRLTLAVAIMTVATFIYLLISFVVSGAGVTMSNDLSVWTITWVIFPAALLVALVVDLIIYKNDGKKAKIIKVALLGVMLFIAAYLSISFATGAWPITWIMFLFAVIAGLIFGLVKLGRKSAGSAWKQDETEHSAPEEAKSPDEVK